MGEKQRYKIVVSDRTGHMLSLHVRFLANVSIPASRRVKSEILKAIRSLVVMPERFPFMENEYIPRGKYHKVCVESRYLVLYQIKDMVVYVDYVIDCREDYGWLI